jgi:hypothetical protein
MYYTLEGVKKQILIAVLLALAMKRDNGIFLLVYFIHLHSLDCHTPSL